MAALLFRGAGIYFPQWCEAVPAQQKQVGFKLVNELSVRKDKDIKIEDTTLYNITGEVAVHKVAEGENLAKISNKY